ncbi:hypothetical protein [Amycolatopsis thailandensis]|uniref:hypothetical protein n=1 Tax=Amycolatopsis thailandensis TaxID=589330 RepID=UPI001177FE1B|nr:hypothetical protein [Amycolatopsis thailandensis]
MLWWQAALWALAGGFVVEGLEFAAVLRRHRLWPWQVDPRPETDIGTTAAGPLGYFIGEVVRLAVGGVLGAALSGQITDSLPALAIGAAAPAVAGNLFAFVPLPHQPDTSQAVNTGAGAGGAAPVGQTGEEASDLGSFPGEVTSTPEPREAS